MKRVYTSSEPNTILQHPKGTKIIKPYKTIHNLSRVMTSRKLL